MLSALAVLSGVAFYGLRICKILLQCLLFGASLASGFVSAFAFYLLTPTILRGVKYSAAHGHALLDVLWPHVHTPPENKYPLVICVTGGAWTIGKRFWLLPLARTLVDAGFAVVTPDYRQYPFGTVDDMVHDVRAALEWTAAAVNSPDGALRDLVDPSRIYLVGQSAGAHVCMLALAQLQREAVDLGIRAFIGVSGVYDVVGMRDHLHARGLHRNIQRLIFAADNDEALSAKCAVRSMLRDERADVQNLLRHYATEQHIFCHRSPETPALSHVPPTAIFIHGRNDVSSPVTESLNMAEAWRKVQRLDDWVVPSPVQVAHSHASPPSLSVRVLERGTHTSPILEDVFVPASGTPALVAAIRDVDAWTTGAVAPPAPVAQQKPNILQRLMQSWPVFTWQTRIARVVDAF